MIYRGCDAGKMQALDAQTGEVRWEHEEGGASPRKGVWSSPAICRGLLFYGAYNGVVYAVNARTGQEIWSQSSSEWIGASPLVVPEHGLVYSGLEYERPWAQGGLVALAMNSGQGRPAGISCSAVTTPQAPVCLTSASVIGSAGPHHRQVCSIRVLRPRCCRRWRQARRLGRRGWSWGRICSPAAPPIETSRPSRSYLMKIEPFAVKP